MNWWLALFGEVAGSHGFGCFTASQPPTSVKECVKKWCALIQPIMRRGMWGPLSISSVRPPRTREPYPIILWFSHFWHEALSHLDQTQFSLMAPANRPSPSRPPATRPASSSADELVSLQRPSHALMNGRVEKSRRSSRAKLKASQERLLGAALSQGAGHETSSSRSSHLRMQKRKASSSSQGSSHASSRQKSKGKSYWEREAGSGRCFHKHSNGRVTWLDECDDGY